MRTPSSDDTASLRSTGADAVAHALKAAGVTQAFGLCGDHVNALFDALDRAGIDIAGSRHESAAVQMADGYARASGRPGVAIVTGGPGHTNAITGAAVAQGAQSPVLIVSGQAPKARRERGGNQSLHQAELMRPVTKWAIEAESSAALAELTLRALTVACSGTPGPVSLSIPTDVADSDASPQAQTLRALHLASGARRPEDADIARAAALLASAQRPVLVLGGCAAQHQPHDALASAVRRLGIPAFTNGHARGVVADDGALVLGHASPLFNGAFRIAADADLWLVGGAAIDYNIASVVAPGASVIQVHRDARQLAVGRVPTLGVEGDTAATLTALADAAPSQARWSAWLEACRARYRAQHAGWSRTLAQARAQRGGIHPAALCEALSRYRTPGMTLVVDVGDFVNWPKAYFPALAPARYMDGGALGNLGGALPIALGAQLARPKDPVWAFTGDGGYGFHSWDLSLAVERKLPLKVIVGNDAAWGTEKRLQCAAYGRDIACELPAIRYDRHAELLGLLAFHAETTGELESIVADFVSASGPCLLDITLAPQAGRPYASGAA